MQSKYLVVLLIVVYLVGCANIDMSKKMQGTALGGIFGGIVGDRVNGKKGAVVGVIVGTIVGNLIGDYLDEEDKKKLALLESQSLESGEATSFVSSKSKAKVTITPQEAKVETKPERSFNVPPDVVMQRLEVAAHGDVKAFVDTPIYPDTNEKSAPKQVIKTGENIRVTANVINKEWGAVVDGNNVVGYVPLRYLNEAIQKQPKTRLTKAPQKHPKLAKTTEIAVAKSGKPNAGTTIVPQAPTTPASAEPGSATVQVARVCKVNLIRIDPSDGKAAVTEERKYCKEPPKGWKVITLATKYSANA